jgi:hypothetical protein
MPIRLELVAAGKIENNVSQSQIRLSFEVASDLRLLQ